MLNVTNNIILNNYIRIFISKFDDQEYCMDNCENIYPFSKLDQQYQI